MFSILWKMIMWQWKYLGYFPLISQIYIFDTRVVSLWEVNQKVKRENPNFLLHYAIKYLGACDEIYLILIKSFNVWVAPSCGDEGAKLQRSSIAEERYFYHSLCTHTTIAPSPLHLRTFVLLTLRPKDESVRVKVAPMEYHKCDSSVTWDRFKTACTGVNRVKLNTKHGFT